MMARRAPTTLSKVLSISSSLDWVRTWIVTSSGIRDSSINIRTKSKSGCEDDGKPTSISLKPILTRTSNRRRLRVTSIGSINAWLPSRRSTLHHAGAAMITAPGQRRSGRSTGGKGRYFRVAIRFMGFGSYVGFLSGFLDLGEMKDLLGREDAGGLASTHRGARLRKEQLAGYESQAHGSPMLPRMAPVCPVAQPQEQRRRSVCEHHAGRRSQDPGDLLDAGHDRPKIGQVPRSDNGDDVVLAGDRVGRLHPGDVAHRFAQGKRLALHGIDEHVGPHLLAPLVIKAASDIEGQKSRRPRKCARTSGRDCS